MTQREQTTARARELWQPDPERRVAAAEIMLAGPLPYETRSIISRLYEIWTENVEQQPERKAA